MSHFTKCQTKLTDKDLLIKALSRLGWEHEVGNFTVTQYGTSEKAEILLSRDSYNKSANALGLSQQKDGTWAMVGDPYHAASQKMRGYYRQEAKFNGDLSTAYAIEEGIAKLSDQGYYCSENAEAKIGADGMITMTFESTY